MLHRIMTLVVKEILAVLKDRKSRLMLTIPPLIQLLIFGFAATLDVKNAPIGILNRDNGEKSIELVQRFHGSPTFTHIVYLDSVEEITSFIDNQYGLMVLSIDEQFSRNLDAGKVANIQLILDGRKSNSAQILAGYVSQIVDRFNKDTAARLGIKLQQSQIFPQNWYNPNLLYHWFTVPSLMGTLTLLAGITVTALSVAREREMGTFDQLLVSPLRPFEIVIGKTIPAIIIGLIEGSFILFSGILLFDIPFRGSFLLLYFSLFVFVSSIVGIGLFISSISKTQQQAILGIFIVMPPSVSLSGFATPIENMPEWLQYVTYILPLRYMLVITKGIFFKAMPADIVLSNTWPMAIIAVFTFSIATWFFSKRLQ